MGLVDVETEVRKVAIALQGTDEGFDRRDRNMTGRIAAEIEMRQARGTPTVTIENLGVRRDRVVRKEAAGQVQVLQIRLVADCRKEFLRANEVRAERIATEVELREVGVQLRRNDNIQVRRGLCSC